jgi:hypothetical protein
MSRAADAESEGSPHRQRRIATVRHAPTIELHYAPPLPLAQQRRVQMAILRVALGGIVVIGGLATVPILRYLRVLQLQVRCLDYQPASDGPVFDSRPAGMPAQQRCDSDYANGSISGVPYVGYVPAVWRRFASAATSGSRAAAVPFLHRLCTPRGLQRLVVVELVQTSTAPGGGGALLSVRVIVPGISGERPRELPSGTTASIDGAARAAVPGELTIYPGCVDPARPDHFTIDLISNGRCDTIDGWLRDDDTVRLEPRTAGFAQSNH